MIDRFDRSRFQAALPSLAGQPLWQRLGIVAGEYCYIIPVHPGVLIYIRSSIRDDGLAAASSKDSIRLWLAADANGKPLGSKDQRWVTRVNGWESRLLETLRKLWRLGRQLGPCPVCNVTMLALKVRKPNSPNHGRWFSSCPQCKAFGRWLTSDSPSHQVSKITMKEGQR